MLGLIILVAVCALAFILYNYFGSSLPIPPEQRLENSIACVIGSSLGAIGGYQGGQRFAARQYQKRFPVSVQEKS